MEKKVIKNRSPVEYSKRARKLNACAEIKITTGFIIKISINY